jgi:hypothetical protein
MAAFDDKELQLQFKGLCNEEFINEGHNTTTKSSFRKKFVFIKKIVLRKASSEDLSVLQDFACKFPSSGIEKYLPQAQAQAQAQAVPQAQVQTVPQAEVLAISTEVAEHWQAKRLAAQQAWFDAMRPKFTDLLHTEPFPDKMDDLSPDELSFFV